MQIRVSLPGAAAWIQHYNRALLACLLSWEWLRRETGLRRLARELVRIL